MRRQANGVRSPGGAFQHTALFRPHRRDHRGRSAGVGAFPVATSAWLCTEYPVGLGWGSVLSCWALVEEAPVEVLTEGLAGPALRSHLPYTSFSWSCASGLDGDREVHLQEGVGGEGRSHISSGGPRGIGTCSSASGHRASR